MSLFSTYANNLPPKRLHRIIFYSKRLHYLGLSRHKNFSSADDLVPRCPRVKPSNIRSLGDGCGDDLYPVVQLVFRGRGIWGGCWWRSDESLWFLVFLDDPTSIRGCAIRE